MKLHKFEMHGGRTISEEGNQEWPDYLGIKVPRNMHLEIIRFLVTSLEDEKMKYSTINLVGALEANGEKSVQELFGPTPVPGKDKE